MVSVEKEYAIQVSILDKFPFLIVILGHLLNI